MAKDLCRVERDSPCGVENLMSTAGAGSNDQMLGRFLPNGRHQNQLANLVRHFEMFPLIPERTGHPATTGRDQANLVIDRELQCADRVGQ